MGTPSFAKPSLQGLLQSQHEVVGVVTQTDKPKGRGRVLTASPIKIESEGAGIPILQPMKMKDPLVLNQLKAWQPDAIVVVAFGKILPQIVLDIPTLGCINVHASLLPKYRGAGPIQWALIRGEQETGVTIMKMDAGMDTGGVYCQERVPIQEDDTFDTLSTRLAETGRALLLASLEGIQDGSLQANPQDHEEATMAPMLKKEDGLIQWDQPAKEIHNKVRGMNPWPGAFTFLQKKRLVICRSEVYTSLTQTDAPGTIVEVTKDRMVVATKEGCLLIKEIQPENKRHMKVEQYLMGHPVTAGMVLTPNPLEP